MTQRKVAIKTFQPYFVFDTERFYQRIIDAYGISHFYSYTPTKGNQNELYLIPDGCSNMLFSYSSLDMKALVVGSTKKKRPIVLDPTREYFGVRFQPGENPCFDKDSVKTFVNGIAQLQDFSHMNALYSEMDQLQSFHERIATFLEAYGKLFAVEGRNKELDLFRQIYTFIVKSKGLLSITELERHIGYSARYINFLFNGHLGICAKQFCQIIKFQNVIKTMNTGSIDNFARLSESFGYYDQSHFIHDFKKFTNKTPSNYLKTIQSSQYGSRIVNV